MKKYKIGIGFLFGLLFSLGCASTNMTSFKDPAFTTKTFHRILIVAPFADLESRTKAEVAFVEHLAKYSVEGIPSIRVFMPTRAYTDEELLDLLSKNGIDGVLQLTLTDSYTTQAYVPPSYSTYGQATLNSTTVINPTVNFSAHTQQYGGYYVSKPRVRYEMRLYDVVSGNTAWVATSLTRGNAFARFDALINSLADSAAEKLKEDGLLR